MEKRYIDISAMFQEADDALFRTILSNRSHVLYTYLTERAEIRTRNHNKFLIPKTSDFWDRHFIIRSLYKKTSTDEILQIKLISRYICRHSILLYVYVYELLIYCYLASLAVSTSLWPLSMYLPMIRGGRTPFPSAPRHFNHWVFDGHAP